MGSKLKWILGIAIIFFLILATNYIDRNNFRRIQESVETIYEDRLVAQHMIFEMSLLINKKDQRRLMPDTTGWKKQNDAWNMALDDLLNRFSRTRLVPNEALTLNKLKNDLDELKQWENRTDGRGSNERYAQLLDRTEQHIGALSRIQLEEGKRQVHISERLMRSVDLLTTYEIYALLFLAVIIQILVIYKPRET